MSWMDTLAVRLALIQVMLYDDPEFQFEAAVGDATLMDAAEIDMRKSGQIALANS